MSLCILLSDLQYYYYIRPGSIPAFSVSVSARVSLRGVEGPALVDDLMMRRVPLGAALIT